MKYFLSFLSLVVFSSYVSSYSTVKKEVIYSPQVINPSNVPVSVDSMGNEVTEIVPKIIPNYFKYNVSFDPVGIILGFYYLTGSYAFHPNVVAKANLGFTVEPFGIEDQSGFSALVGVGFYFDKAFKGPFVEPALSFTRLKDSSINKSATAFGPQTNLGYHWTWDSGLNMAVAVGVQRNFVSDDSPQFEDFGKFRATGFFRFGWAFN